MYRASVRPRQVRYQAALRPDLHSIINERLHRRGTAGRCESLDLQHSISQTSQHLQPPLRYNFFPEVMPNPRYALVAYVRNPVGQFVEDLRRQIHPDTAHMAAHVTILPPRELLGSEAAALEFLEEACSRVIPFDVELGDVETFLPVTPTVFIQVRRAAYRLRELHDQLSTDALCCAEDWPYMPHLTIAKVSTEQQAREAYEIANRRWAEFPSPRTIHISELMFVKEEDGSWHDVAAVPLGRSLLSSRV